MQDRINVSEQLSLLLEGGPCERQSLLGVSPEDSEWGVKDLRRYVALGHRGSGISAANALVFAAPPCTAGT